MRSRHLVITLLSLACSGSVASAQSLFVKPVKVFGDPHFTGTVANPLALDSIGPNVVEGRELSQPLGIALDSSVTPPIVYIADTGNNRVLAWQYATQLTPGAPADLVLGQPDRFTNLPQGPNGGLFSTGLRAPTGLAVDASGNLYVADSGNNRILRYPKPFSQPTGAYQSPDLIIGQTSFSGSGGNTGGVKASTLLLTSGSAFLPHTGLAFDSAGNLWVTDTGNNRVLRFPVSALTAGQNGASADVVIGQADLVSSAAGSSRISKTTLVHPTGVSFDPQGRILVADGLARVLVFPAGSGTNASATRILGVPTQQAGQPPPPAVSATALNSVFSAIATSTGVLVADTGDNRVLIYTSIDAWPSETTAFSPAAVNVLGQAAFADSKANKGGADASAGSLTSPVDMASANGELFVVDSGNNRVLVFPFSSSTVSITATRVIGQLDFPYRAPNLVEGKEFNFSVAGGLGSGSAVLDLNSTPPHLYIADTKNNRILGYSDFTHTQNGQPADLVIGQPDLFRTVVNYPSNDPNVPSAQGLAGPTSLALDSSGNLYVSDTSNSRILRFPAPFASGKSALESADLVIGQSDFQSIVTDPTGRNLNAPLGIALTKDAADTSITGSGWLLVADANHNRVLFFQKPFSNGMTANKVLGQANLGSADRGADGTHLNLPAGVAVDPRDRVLVADSGNARVQVFDFAQGLSNFSPASYSLTSNLSQPAGIGVGSNGQFWVADASQNALIHFPSPDQLPLKNYLSDASLPAVSPRSAFVDQYNNLLVADGINRVLYYAPQVAVVNAANYIPGRALAPGTFAAVFPTGANTLSAGTDTASSFPLATSLADTQVIVNNTPSSLFFVSPGQINLPLSLSLPAGGTVDLQVVSASTGQIYGGAEVPLSSVSPGLFTSAGSGTGQVASINAQDGTKNSPSNPVARGQYITLYGTGQGFVPNAPPDGQASSDPLAAPTNPQILLGGAFVPDTNVTYSGLAPTLVGVWQINFLVPLTAPTGNNVPIKVLINSVPSDNPSVPGQIATSIAIK